FAPGEAFFVDRDAELLRDGVDVAHVEVDERVGPRVALVLGEVEPNRPACDRDEPRKAGLELMLPLLLESEPSVPGDRPRCVLDVQDGDDLFHADEVTTLYLPDCSSHAAMTASSTASAFPSSRSATIIMCFAKRFGTENVSGNDCCRKSLKSNDARMTTCLSSSCRASKRPRYRQSSRPSRRRSATPSS